MNMSPLVIIADLASVYGRGRVIKVFGDSVDDLQDGKQGNQVAGKQKGCQPGADSDAQGSGDLVQSAIGEEMGANRFCNTCSSRKKATVTVMMPVLMIEHQRSLDINLISFG